MSPRRRPPWRLPPDYRQGVASRGGCATRKAPLYSPPASSPLVVPWPSRACIACFAPCAASVPLAYPTTRARLDERLRIILQHSPAGKSRLCIGPSYETRSIASYRLSQALIGSSILPFWLIKTCPRSGPREQAGAIRPEEKLSNGKRINEER